MSKRTIADCDAATFSGKRVLVRVDFNVPQNEDLTVADDSRIRAALPTIEYLRRCGARLVLVSHLGRPKGVAEKFSLKPVAQRLSELIGSPVKFAGDCVGAEAGKVVNSLADAEVCLLENVRFHAEEEKNDPGFARQLASLCDVYVNDAFGTAHRAHASTRGVADFVRPALAGLLMDKEVRALSEMLQNPARPFATVIGGAKVSSKIGVLESLISRVDVLVIGGAMAFSFLKAQGKQVGKSLVEDDRLEFCKDLERRAKERGVSLVLPVDVVCATDPKIGLATVTVSVDAIPADQMGLDVGPQTMAAIRSALSGCRTILWNGPLGVFEIPGFEGGTYELIDILVDLTGRGVKTVVGGGDSVAAIEARDIAAERFSHVSTGGGASLEFIEGLELPGIACLDEQERAAVK
ncbi:MAG TPA: phosphoglycerate kinase [Candidatus Obscuribacterales bacterium]